MDQSYSESDISLSPSQILDRLQVLRQLQILQRGKLQKHRLQYENSPEITSSLTEIVSHFSNSTSYNTFRSLLQSSQETSHEISPCSNTSSSLRKENLQNVIEGVSVLNLSEESEFIANSVSPRSLASARSVNENDSSPHNNTPHNIQKKQISLDEMPILTPKKNFEMLIEEKLKNEKVISKETPVQPKSNDKVKRTFLKRGEGTARFGLKKNNLVIQNTKSLPWKKKQVNMNSKQKSKVKTTKPNNGCNNSNNDAVQVLENCNELPIQKSCLKDISTKSVKRNSMNDPKRVSKSISKDDDKQTSNTSDKGLPPKSSHSNINYLPKEKPLGKTGKTWASVLTKEQDDFLRQLKQSDYYKNFVSPVKSTISDTSCNENLFKIHQEREIAEQNMFELIENKVTHDSFNINSSFFNQFLRNSNTECSGESTPLVMQKCLFKNPNLMHILPLTSGKTNETSCSDTCNSDCTECSENCSTISSCSCETITRGNKSLKDGHSIEKGSTNKGPIPKSKNKDDMEEEKCHNDISTSENNVMNSNMAEMNAKLIATSDLLKDRLRELEDEIETFRKENTNLTKMREEVDQERQKFYEEKMAFEQKFNEEKILSEYYLAEEKEKLTKQKQTYERYVREIRGRLNKKEKEEITNLKKEIHDLKDEIRVKDAKSTSIIARLRNQLKILEKEKKNLDDQIDKLNKENRRIKHSNDITRRLTNLKYLEQINKKLTNMTSKESRSEVELDSNIKYKAYEIERQSRVRKKHPVTKGTIKPRAKSVPNLHVTSRYAKYFSQKDSLSNRDNNMTLTEDNDCAYSYTMENELSDSDRKSNDNNSNQSDSNSENEENNLERLYLDRFRSISPTTQPQNKTNQPKKSNRLSKGTNDYFIASPNNFSSELHVNNNDGGSRNSRSPSIPASNRVSNSSKSPTNFWTGNRNQSELHIDLSSRSKSPVSILSNRSSSCVKSGLGINQEVGSDNMVSSPEPTSSKTNLSKTNLNPTEIKKPDGSKELRFPNGNIKFISADGKHSKFIYYNGDIKENFYNEGRIKYYYAETKTFHTTHPDGLEVLEFPDGQIEKRYKDGSSEIRLPNGSVRYYDPKNEHVREEWRFPDGTALTVSSNGEQRIVFANGQVEVHAKDHKRREFPDGSVKLIYNDGTAETRYASGRVRIKDKHGNLIMDSAPG